MRECWGYRGKGSMQGYQVNIKCAPGGPLVESFMSAYARVGRTCGQRATPRLDIYDLTSMRPIPCKSC